MSLFKKRKASDENQNKKTPSDSSKKVPYTNLEENIDYLKKIFELDDTLQFRILQNRQQKSLRCCVVYVEGMVDHQILNEFVIEPIINNEAPSPSRSNYVQDLQSGILAASDVWISDKVGEITDSILRGEVAVILDGHEQVLVICCRGMPTRAIGEAVSEKVVRGPHEGFTEPLHVNLTLIRRRIANPDLKFQYRYVGKTTKTKVCLCYMKSIASSQVVDEVVRRLDEITLDGVIDSGYIQEMIKDAPFSPFDTIGHTERPDSIVGKLLEGRVAIVVDGSPFVLTVPFVFTENFQSSEDYYNNFAFASFNRLLRIFGALLALFVPAVYISLTNFHLEMLPTPLLLSIAAGRSDVPFPTVVEAFLMLIVFEILREAGARMPTAIGQATSIVGALVLGQAAVDAKYIAPSMIIIVALTGISALMSVKIQGPILILRFALLILAAVMGIYGVIFGALGLIIHLMSIRSFGIPYMLTEGSIRYEDIKDSTIRAPWWYMQYRPQLITMKNRRRMGKTSRKD